MLNFEDKNKCMQNYQFDAAFSEIFQQIFIHLDKIDATMHNMLVRSSFLFYLGEIWLEPSGKYSLLTRKLVLPEKSRK